MKPFTFSLERMRDYKIQMLDTEKNALSILNKRLRDIEEKIRLSEEFLRQKRREMQAKQIRGGTMREFDELRFYLENTRKRLEALAEERVKALLEAERQRKVVLAASQEVSGLDKLEEKQLDDYRYLEARDNERSILEHVTTQLAYPREASGI